MYPWTFFFVLAPILQIATTFSALKPTSLHRIEIRPSSSLKHKVGITPEA
jgi:hypothetical protein